MTTTTDVQQIPRATETPFDLAAEHEQALRDWTYWRFLLALPSELESHARSRMKYGEGPTDYSVI